MDRQPAGKPDKPEQTRKHEEKLLDKSLEDTFPASDPPSQTDPTKGLKKEPLTKVPKPKR